MKRDFFGKDDNLEFIWGEYFLLENRESLQDQRLSPVIRKSTK